MHKKCRNRSWKLKKVYYGSKHQTLKFPYVYICSKNSSLWGGSQGIENGKYKFPYKCSSFILTKVALCKLVAMNSLMKLQLQNNVQHWRKITLTEKNQFYFRSTKWRIMVVNANFDFSEFPFYLSSHKW